MQERHIAKIGQLALENLIRESGAADMQSLYPVLICGFGMAATFEARDLETGGLVMRMNHAPDTHEFDLRDAGTLDADERRGAVYCWFTRDHMSTHELFAFAHSTFERLEREARERFAREQAAAAMLTVE